MRNIINLGIVEAMELAKVMDEDVILGEMIFFDNNMNVAFFIEDHDAVAADKLTLDDIELVGRYIKNSDYDIDIEGDITYVICG